jgi:hypothetical protein
MSSTDYLSVRYADIEAALLEWHDAHDYYEAAAARHAKLVARTPAVSRALKMTPHEVAMQRRYALTGTCKRGGHDTTAARKWANFTYFSRSPLAQRWHTQLTEAEVGLPPARDRLKEAARAHVGRLGLRDAAVLTGVSEEELSGLCRAHPA